MATLYARDGKYYDDEGYEVDASGRRFLQKMPHVVARIAEIKQQVLNEQKHRKHVYEETELGKQERFLNERFHSLREDLHHLNCHENFINDVSSLRGYERIVDDVDEQIRQLRAYKERVQNIRYKRDELKREIADSRLRKQIELASISKELHKVQGEARSKPSKANAKPDVQAKLRAKAESFLSMMTPSVVESYLAQGMTREKLVEQLMFTLKGQK